MGIKITEFEFEFIEAGARRTQAIQMVGREGLYRICGIIDLYFQAVF